jgi:hypothetical protein
MERTMQPRLVSALILGSLAAAPPLAGQDVSGLTPGTRIRVEAPPVTADRVSGSLRSLDATALHLTLEDGKTLAVPRDAVESIDVSAGRRSHWIRGAGIGALAGLAFSGTLVIIGSADDDDGLDSLDRALYGAVIVTTTAGGAVLGAITGALIRTEQWEPIAPADVQWGVGPVAGGAVGVTVSLRF